MNRLVCLPCLINSHIFVVKEGNGCTDRGHRIISADRQHILRLSAESEWMGGVGGWGWWPAIYVAEAVVSMFTGTN